MKSLRGVSSRRLSFIVVVTFSLASATEGAPSEDGSSVPRRVAADALSPSLPASPPSPLTASGESSTNEEKVLFECRHSDYRTYIKCLKRQKRHHWQQQQQQQRNEHETSEGGEPKRCFAECGFDDCESTKCIYDCHKRCMKKTKETRQIITQYETTCLDGTDDCTKNPDGDKPVASPTTNVTTNIDINNVINNHRETPSVQPCSRFGGSGCDSRIALMPQLQLVPQITFGLGIGYGINLHQDGVGVGGGRIDCSPCGNPWMRYQCDVSCYARQESQVPNLPKQASEGTSGGGGGGGGGGGTGSGSAPGANCILPYCVGGSPS